MYEFAKKTGQLTKFQLCQFVGIVSFLVSISRMSKGGSAFSILLGIGAFIFYVQSVRCPKCRKSLTWYHEKHTKLTNAYVAKDTCVSCPICGYNPFAEQI